ncbi:RlpA-like double-psi beta-barrel-protein domain-containing protein-containing protein, partial [Mycena rosella]
ATVFTPSDAPGACGVVLNDSLLQVALSSEDFAGGANCGRNVDIHVDGLVSVIATVQDECPGCPADGLDLTAGLFSMLADPVLGSVEVQWNLV